MSLKQWLFSSYSPNPHVDGAWGLFHILVLVGCVALIVGFYFLFRKQSYKSKRILLFVLAGLILLFELTRRSVNLIKMPEYTFHNVMRDLLPRPWCAISCWSIMFAVAINKKWAYNFASVSSILCAFIFFAYPGVGFNNKFILFENLYSIATHSLFFIASVTFITLKFARFEFKNIWKEAIYYAVVLAYVFLIKDGLKIEGDPMYFMPGNDVQEILGISYGLFLPLYIVFVLTFFASFYFVPWLKGRVKRKHN